MTTELGIALAAVIFGMSGLICGAICFARYRNCVVLFEVQGGQLEDLENAVAESKRLLETNSQKMADNTRRIAWLETRVRQPKAVEPETEPETLVANTSGTYVPNITERRHRVLSLAARGQNVESIAATLGMMQGEVELILNLNRSSV